MQNQTKSVSDTMAPLDGLRILVTRYWPDRRQNKEQLALHCWMRELAPSPELLEDWRHGGITWDE